MITIGMDCYIWESRTHKVFDSENWYNNPNVRERMYWRKNWSLVENCSFVPKDYESGDFIQLNSKNLEEMIKVACAHRDYWGTYDTVPHLCELRDELITWETDGDDRKLYLEYDW